MSDKQRLLARIRRLMALGTRNSNLHEAARAVGLAQKLMQRHNLSLDDLKLTDVRESVCRQLWSDAEKIPAWLNALATVVCMTTGCRCWFSWYLHTSLNGTQKQRRSLHFYGLNERADVAAYVFTVLARQLRASTEKHMASHRGRRGRIKLQTLRTRADQYREGWVTGVWLVLQSFSPSIEETHLLQRWLSKRLNGGALESLAIRDAGTCRGDRAARIAGWLAGREAELNHGLAGSQALHQITAGGSNHD